MLPEHSDLTVDRTRNCYRGIERHEDFHPISDFKLVQLPNYSDSVSVVK